MSPWLIIMIAGITLVTLIIFILRLLQPRLIAKDMLKNEKLFSMVKELLVNNNHQAMKDLVKWRSGDNVARMLETEEQILDRIRNNILALQHEEALHDKYFRLVKLYSFKKGPKEFDDSIITYKGYLKVKLAEHKNGLILAKALTSGALSFAECAASANKTVKLLQDIESKLDTLLAQGTHQVPSN